MIIDKLNEWIEFVENRPLDQVSAKDALLYLAVMKEKQKLENRIVKNMLNGDALPF